MFHVKRRSVVSRETVGLESEPSAAAVELADLEPKEFAERLSAASGQRLPERAQGALYAHFQELRRWAPRVALVGPSFAHDLFERHYGESLAGLGLLAPGAARLLDLGSGAGFPGLVLAAARPDLEVLLLEPRERKWAFLQAASRRAGLGCRVVNARVSADPTTLPGEIRDIAIVTVRALRLDVPAWDALSARLLPDCQLLSWGAAEPPRLPSGFAAGRTLSLAGERRILREFRWRGGPAAEAAGRR